MSYDFSGLTPRQLAIKRHELKAQKRASSKLVRELYRQLEEAHFRKVSTVRQLKAIERLGAGSWLEGA